MCKGKKKILFLVSTKTIITRSVFVFMQSSIVHPNRLAIFHKNNVFKLQFVLSGRMCKGKKKILFLVSTKTIITRSVFVFMQSSIVHSNRLAILHKNNVFKF